MKPLGPRTQYALNITFLILQGLNGGVALYTEAWGKIPALSASLGLGIASAAILFTITGVRPPAKV